MEKGLLISVCILAFVEGFNFARWRRQNFINRNLIKTDAKILERAAMFEIVPDFGYKTEKQVEYLAVGIRVTKTAPKVTKYVCQCGSDSLDAIDNFTRFRCKLRRPWNFWKHPIIDSLV